MIKIIPAVLATMEEEYKKKLKIASSLSDWAHIDIVDGIFAENKTVPLTVMKKYKSKANLEAHLMVETPSLYLEPLIKHSFAKIIFPAETKENLPELIGKVRKKKVLVGLSLNPNTLVRDTSYLFDQVDFVLLLGVTPGFGGQEFSQETLIKLRELVSIAPAGVRIEVDGGIKPANAGEIANTGADILVIGSALINTPNPKEEYVNILRSLY